MKRPVFHRSRMLRDDSRSERGVTIALVALAMVAIIAMAALSIDVVTLYLAREEAQRSADAAALSAARILSLSGITGDPANSTLNWGAICGPDDGVNGVATRAAKAMVAQNTVGGIAPATINVTYSAGTNGTVGAGTTDCTTLSGSAFGVNPLVTVQLTRPALPTFFSRFWGKSGSNVSATATAEAFNSSNSGNVGNQTTGDIVPVQPRCVKPWVVPNQDPRHPDGCTNSSTCSKFVDLATGKINNQGISLNGGSLSGVIGETFWLVADCHHGNPNSCNLRASPPQANYTNPPTTFTQPAPNLLYLPGQVNTQANAIPSCTNGNPFNQAIVGCDQATNYTCGVPAASGGMNAIDLSENPRTDTPDGVQCLIHQSDTSNWTQSSGQDYFNPFAAPASYPFQILAGSNNPLVGAGLPSGTAITSSPSIVSIPIYDDVTGPTPPFNPPGVSNVTFVGFLQVFINAADDNGNVNVTVLNVAGCGNGSGGNVSTNTIGGTSPVPVRLITPP